MFGLSKKRKPTVTPEDKEWIENNFIWLIESFGFPILNEQPFILPTMEVFPYNNCADAGQFQKLFEQLCKYWSVDKDDIVVKIFDDFKSKQWSSYRPSEKFNEPLGFYYQNQAPSERKFNIQLAKSNLNNVQLLISVIAHELAHVKLLGGSFVNQHDADMEPLTDLASIYFGFGIFVANSCETKDLYWIGRRGYLPNEVISYSNALLCFISNKPAEKFIQYLNTNTRSLFIQDYKFLKSSNNSTLTNEKLRESIRLFDIKNQIGQGFKSKSFEMVIDASLSLLEIKPKDISAFNNLGYAQLQLKRYKEAIEIFTKAIDIEPHWDYPYNNRGYCKLQLGDLENAHADLHTAFEMNPDNSFSWRNMGAYFLKVNNFNEAMYHLEKAIEIDPKTELINFYLGQTHLQMGNEEKAKYYLNKSMELNEHNDSVIA